MGEHKALYILLRSEFSQATVLSRNTLRVGLYKDETANNYLPSKETPLNMKLINQSG